MGAQLSRQPGQEAGATPCLDLSLTPFSSTRVPSCLEENQRASSVMQGQREGRKLPGRQWQLGQNKLNRIPVLCWMVNGHPLTNYCRNKKKERKTQEFSIECHSAHYKPEPLGSTNSVGDTQKQEGHWYIPQRPPEFANYCVLYPGRCGRCSEEHGLEAWSSL